MGQVSRMRQAAPPPGMLEAARRVLRSVTHLEARPTSSATWLLRLLRADGTAEICVAKWASPLEARLYTGGAVTQSEAGAPSLRGAWGRWLFLEQLPEHFPDATDAQQVTAVYHHLGRLHAFFAGRALPDLPGSWTTEQVRTLLGAFPRVAPHAEQITHSLGDGPRTLIHGDYHRWNLILQGDRVRVLDWEHAAMAHPIFDLTLLAPDEPGWDGVPRASMADAALAAYHAAGPLAHLPWGRFLELHTKTRLVIAARQALAHKARLERDPGGPPADLIRSYFEAELERVHRLTAALGW